MMNWIKVSKQLLHRVLWTQKRPVIQQSLEAVLFKAMEMQLMQKLVLLEFTVRHAVTEDLTCKWLPVTVSHTSVGLTLHDPTFPPIVWVELITLQAQACDFIQMAFIAEFLTSWGT
mmetsp:Transcript_4383/g.6222  ORF Transcript_4383/g.6222 Transcript_4383/m.6222 type:complete len:116 (+) Transcript_4383:151-498(+)